MRKGREYLVVTYTPRRAKLIKEAEASAEREVNAAVEMDGVHSRPPYYFLHDPEIAQERYEWYVDVFGASEDELIAALNVAARQVRRSRWPWRWRTRREAFRRYIRIEAQLNRAIGLETEWR